MNTYENREIARALAQIAQVDAAPLAERKLAAVALLDDMGARPELIGERVQWLLDGNYGHGAQLLALRAAATRGNRSAQLMGLIAPLEWNATARSARNAWQLLSAEQQTKLNEELANAQPND